MGQPGVGLGHAGQHPGELLLAGRPSSSRVSPELVTEPSLAFSTRTCRSAYAATCGRWVTTSTCAVRASWASRRPTSTAAAPPTPASTSSNTNVGTGLVPASATSRASITRDSSPPDAPLCSGRGSAPGVGGQQELDLVDAARRVAEPAAADPQRAAAGRRVADGGSASCWVTVIWSRASGMASSDSSAVTSSDSLRRGLAAGAPTGSARPRRARRAATSARPAAPRCARRCRRGRAAGRRRSRTRPAPPRRSRRTCGSARSAPPGARTRAARRAGSASTPAA